VPYSSSVRMTLTKRAGGVLAKYAAVLGDALDQIIGEVMVDVAMPEAQRLCPVDTGALKGSIRVERIRKNLWKLIAGDVVVTVSAGKRGRARTIFRQLWMVCRAWHVSHGRSAVYDSCY
jgi:hypothetical protein